MRIHIESTGVGGGTSVIKLPFNSVMKKLEDANKRLLDLELPKPKDTYGKNDLKFTNEWLEREDKIQAFFTQYIEAVQKNLTDTQVTIQKLKEQDEVLGR